MPGSLTSWGQSCARVIALRLYCLLLLGGHGLPKFAHFRRSMAGLYAPLSTLHAYPRGYAHMTRGQCGSLALSLQGLAPFTSYRSPGAP